MDTQNMDTQNMEKLAEMIEDHRRWLRGLEGGNRANLTKANLTGAYLNGAYLTRAELTGADLTRADLNGAELSGAELTGAYLTRADLNGANLTGAYLSGANLAGANLAGAELNKEIITIAPVTVSGLRWPITIGDKMMKIGCQTHPISKWKSFKDSYIARMDDGAVKFWEIWKELLLAMCDAHTSLIPVKTEEESK